MFRAANQPNPKTSTSVKLLGCGGVLILALSTLAQTITDTVPKVNPVRPTVSTPATLNGDSLTATAGAAEGNRNCAK
jgi:hypothetical protein